MPSFEHKDGRDIVSIVTGPSHIQLGLRFEVTSCGAESPLVVQLPPVGTCDHGPIDESELVTAVIAAVKGVAEELEANVAVHEVVYVANDSPHYGMYAYGATLLARKWVESFRESRA